MYTLFKKLPLEPFLVKNVSLSLLTDEKDPGIVLSVCFPAFGQTSREGPERIIWRVAVWIRQDFRCPEIIGTGA